MHLNKNTFVKKYHYKNNEMENKKNDFVSVSFYPAREYQKAYIIVRDYTDKWNEPTAYTRKIRGIDKAWAYIKDQFNENMHFSNITHILDNDFKLDTHYYCAMD